MSLETTLDSDGATARITLDGDLDASTAPIFFARISEAARARPDRLVLQLDRLRYMSSAGLRGLAFARQKMGDEVEIVVVGATPVVLETLRLTGFDQSVTMTERYPG